MPLRPRLGLLLALGGTAGLGACRLAEAQPANPAPKATKAPASPSGQGAPSPGLPARPLPSPAPQAAIQPGPGALDPVAPPAADGPDGADGVALALAVDPLPQGKATLTLSVGGEALTLYCHKPASYQGTRMILVFHGVNRDAEAYRDRAVAMGEAFGALVVAPLFDADRFPTERYQRGGVLKQGVAVPASDRTAALVGRLAQALRQREGHPDMPYALIGHSAGAQALVRLAAFGPNGAQRIVAANPGTLTFPNQTAAFPYGFAGLPSGLGEAASLKAYLAQPLTIYLGDQDLLPDENLDTTAQAMAQGPNRFARGQAAFAAAQSLATSRGWPFGWKLVVATGVGHSSSGMFRHPSRAEALGW